MISVTAEAPTGENSKSRVIRHKTKQKVHKVAQHKNTLLWFIDRLCVDVTCNAIQILTVLSVSTSHIWYGSSRSPSHTYQVSNCIHVAYRTQTTKLCSPSRTVIFKQQRNAGCRRNVCGL